MRRGNVLRKPPDEEPCPSSFTQRPAALNFTDQFHEVVGPGDDLSGRKSTTQTRGSVEEND
jgi:hypothetical protein